jgi:phosphinothricin acetyltransferase
MSEGGERIVRPARPDDSDEIAAIYAHHVWHGTATFDTEPPSTETWQARIAEILNKGWPFLVVTEQGEILGYAYVAQFRDRPAYAHSCEDSIYLRDGLSGQGLGSMLLTALITDATTRGFTQMLAVIGGDSQESIKLHERHGFRYAGRMEKVGYKFDRWLDTVYMQRALGDEAKPATEDRKTAPISDLAELLRRARPHLSDTRYAITTGAKADAPLPNNRFALIREEEGVTSIHVAPDGNWALIIMTVTSDLSAVGFTAAFARALTDCNIPANVVAAYHHDHILVPWDRRDDALAALSTLIGDTE